MSESDELIRVLTKRIAEQIDMDNISSALRVVANEALKLSVDTSGLTIAANQFAKSLSILNKSHSESEYVSDEACNLADQIVDQVEINPIFDNCTFNFNVPEKDNRWTRNQIMTLISLIAAILFGVIGVYQNWDKEELHNTDMLENQSATSIEEFNDILTVASKLAQIMADSSDITTDVFISDKTNDSLKQ